MRRDRSGQSTTQINTQRLRPSLRKFLASGPVPSTWTELLQNRNTVSASRRSLKPSPSRAWSTLLRAETGDAVKAGRVIIPATFTQPLRNRRQGLGLPNAFRAFIIKGLTRMTIPKSGRCRKGNAVAIAAPTQTESKTDLGLSMLATLTGRLRNREPCRPLTPTGPRPAQRRPDADRIRLA